MQLWSYTCSSKGEAQLDRCSSCRHDASVCMGSGSGEDERQRRTAVILSPLGWRASDAVGAALRLHASERPCSTRRNAEEGGGASKMGVTVVIHVTSLEICGPKAGLLSGSENGLDSTAAACTQWQSRSRYFLQFPRRGTHCVPQRRYCFPDRKTARVLHPLSFDVSTHLTGSLTPPVLRVCVHSQTVFVRLDFWHPPRHRASTAQATSVWQWHSHAEALATARDKVLLRINIDEASVCLHPRSCKGWSS